jgi:hypothetical protein
VSFSEFCGRGGTIVIDNNVLLAQNLQTLLVEYFTLKKDHRAGFDLLASYIESLANRLEIPLPQSEDIREMLRAIDAEIDRLKDLEKSNVES